MTLQHHLFRIASSIIIAGSFLYALINTSSWLWIGEEAIGFLLVCRVIIWIDTAHEIDD